MTMYPVRMQIVSVAQNEKRDFLNGEILFGMFSTVIEIKVHTNGFFFFFLVNKAYNVYITNQTNLRKVVVCFVVVTIVCFHMKLAPDKPTWQKYDHSNLIHSLHVGVIKLSTLHFRFHMI